LSLFNNVKELLGQQPTKSAGPSVAKVLPTSLATLVKKSARLFAAKRADLMGMTVTTGTEPGPGRPVEAAPGTPEIWWDLAHNALPTPGRTGGFRSAARSPWLADSGIPVLFDPFGVRRGPGPFLPDPWS
jgi:hypothetical protein